MVLVSWTPPTPLPDGYLVQYVMNGTTISTQLEGVALQYVVTGLVDRANYTVSIRSFCDTCIPSLWGVASFVVTGEYNSGWWVWWCDIVMM